MRFHTKTDGYCTKNDGSFTKNDEFLEELGATPRHSNSNPKDLRNGNNVDFLIETLDFALKCLNFVLNLLDFLLKMLDFTEMFARMAGVAYATFARFFH